MSAATATLLAGLLAIFGTLLGTLVGLAGDRWLRSLGEVRCELASFEWEPLLKAPNGMTFSAPDNIDELPETGLTDRGVLTVRYDLDLRFFNEKDEQTGLQALSMAFIDSKQGEAILGPLSGKCPPSPPANPEALPSDLLNLPSQQWTTRRISGTLQGADALQASRWRRMEVRAKSLRG